MLCFLLYDRLKLFFSDYLQEILYLNKFRLVLQSLGLTICLVIVKIIIDILGLDSLETSPVITAIVAGVIFTIAIIFSGVLLDYKEAEKIPGELAPIISSPVLAMLSQKMLQAILLRADS